MIELRVCDLDGTSVQPVRVADDTGDDGLVRNANWLDELNEVGAGGFDVHVTDGRLAQLVYGRLVQCFLDGEHRFTWRIDRKTTLRPDEREHVAEWRTVMGMGAMSLLTDAKVYPQRSLERNSPDDRLWTPASDHYDEDDDGRWTSAHQSRQQSDTGSWPWFFAPVNWPEEGDNAWWIWDRQSDVPVPPGFCHFRKTFTTSGPVEVAVFVSGDNAFDLFIDGYALVREDFPWAWRSTHRFDITLDAGEHVIYARVENYASPGGNTTPAGFILTMHELVLSSEGDELLGEQFVKTDSSWSALGYPDPPPGFWPGEIMRIMHAEAVARGVSAMEAVTLDFTDTLDTDGNPYLSRLDFATRVGTDYLHLARTLTEMGVDIRITPDLKLQMRVHQGANLSGTVALAEGANLLSGEHDGQAGKSTALLMRDNDGWSEAVLSAGVAEWGRREGFLSLGDSTSVEQSQRVAVEAFRLHGNPHVASAFRVAYLEGALPYVDFDVGDDVTAIGDGGSPTSRRVFSIGIEEDENGEVTTSVETDRPVRDPILPPRHLPATRAPRRRPAGLVDVRTPPGER